MVKDQAQKTFEALDIESAMRFPEFRSIFGQKDTLAQYVIAGYEDRNAKLVWIHYSFDWAVGKLKAAEEDDSPKEPYPDFAFVVEGINFAVAQIPNRTSSAYRQCLLYAGSVTDKFLSLTPLTIPEATLL